VTVVSALQKYDTQYKQVHIHNIIDCPGGWLNASSADWFEEYARLCFTEFGEEVKFWITFNEPKETSIQGKKNLSQCRGRMFIIMAQRIYRSETHRPCHISQKHE
jgi:beta-glucosidase/6-phospho-beta-glucosidase/beta-galactosidase